jgi:hypothetical protein
MTRRDLFAARMLDGCLVLPIAEAARLLAPLEHLALVRVEAPDASGTLTRGALVMVDREEVKVTARAVYLLRLDGEVQLRRAWRCPRTGGVALGGATPGAGCAECLPAVIPATQAARVQVLGRALTITTPL